MSETKKTVAKKTATKVEKVFDVDKHLGQNVFIGLPAGSIKGFVMEYDKANSRIKLRDHAAAKWIYERDMRNIDIVDPITGAKIVLTGSED